MDNCFTTISLLSALKKIGVGGCETARASQTGFPKEFKFDKKKAKLDYHFKSGIVRDKVGVLVWIYSAPVVMMTTIHVTNGY